MTQHEIQLYQACFSQGCHSGIADECIVEMPEFN